MRLLEEVVRNGTRQVGVLDLQMCIVEFEVKPQFFLSQVGIRSRSLLDIDSVRSSFLIAGLGTDLSHASKASRLHYAFFSNASSKFR